MALDQGTSSSRAIIYDAIGQVVTVAQTDIDLFFPADGWVEQDPEQLWQSILTVGRQAIAQSGLAADAIKAIGITNQRETTLLWERASGACVHNALVWQDRRGAAHCSQRRAAHAGGHHHFSLFASRACGACGRWLQGWFFEARQSGVGSAFSGDLWSGKWIGRGGLDSYNVTSSGQGNPWCDETTRAVRFLLKNARF